MGHAEVSEHRLDAIATRLGAERGEHRLRGVDPDDAQTALGQRQRERAGTDAELEHRAVTGEGREGCDRGVDVGRIVVVEEVVERRDGIAVRAGVPVDGHAGSLEERSRPTPGCTPALLFATVTDHLVVVVQARMGSTRLPGKVLRPLGDRPVLQWVLDAARVAGVGDRVVVATTVDERDDPIVDAATAAGAGVYRGSEHDVLERFLGVADETGADALVRLTADCPFLDPAVIRAAAEEFRAGGADLVTTGSPGDLPRGLDVEVVRVDVLRVAAARGTAADHEHVTAYVEVRPDDVRRAGAGVRRGTRRTCG